MSGIRKPKDDAEKIKARMAIAQGKGTSLEDFIENITVEKPEEEFVQAIKNLIELAHEQEETLDIVALIKQMEELQNQWA